MDHNIDNRLKTAIKILVRSNDRVNVKNDYNYFKILFDDSEECTDSKKKLIRELYLNYRRRQNLIEFVSDWIKKFIQCEHSQKFFIFVPLIYSNLEIATLLKDFIRSNTKELSIFFSNYVEEIDFVVKYLEDLDMFDLISLYVSDVKSNNLNLSSYISIFKKTKSFYLSLEPAMFHPFNEIVDVLKNSDVKFDCNLYNPYYEETRYFVIGLIDSIIPTNIEFEKIDIKTMPISVQYYLDHSALIPNNSSDDIMSEIRHQNPSFGVKSTTRHTDFRIVIEKIRSKIADGTIDIGERRCWSEAYSEEKIIQMASCIQINCLSNFTTIVPYNKINVRVSDVELETNRTFEEYGVEWETSIEIW